MNVRSDVEIVLVGNELLKGQRSDSHVRYIGGELLKIGVRVVRTHTVSDSIDARRLLARPTMISTP